MTPSDRALYVRTVDMITTALKLARDGLSADDFYTLTVEIEEIAVEANESVRAEILVRGNPGVRQ